MSEEWRTEHLALRAPVASDRLEYLGLFLDPEMRNWLRPTPAPPFSVNDLDQMLDQDILHWEVHGFGPWAMIKRDSGEFIGRGGLRWTTIEDELAVELPWAIASNYWRQGLATEAACAALTWAKSLGFDPVFALIRPANRASQRVAEKAGLRATGETEHAGFSHLIYRSSA